MRDHILFYVNGKAHSVAGKTAFISLSDYLRGHERLIGTKVVCAEGDCGSCSVLIGRTDGRGALKYAAITSCIKRLFQLDGAHVVTIEGLRGRDGEPNAIQQSMARCGGAQCGFCTPGFVVALYQMANDNIAATRENATRALVGNLCRCTGYDAILCAAVETDRELLPTLSALYADGEMIEALSVAAKDDVLIETPAQRVYKPATLAQALKYRAQNPHATVVAGGTDVGVLANKRAQPLTGVLSVAAVQQMSDIEVTDASIRIGAAATLTDLERVALEALPPLGEFLKWFGSPPIKNAGTLAGNLATGSPIGDLLPVLMVLDAEVELSSWHERPAHATRKLPLHAFYTGYRKSVLRADELITAVCVPRLCENETLKLYKISKRRDLDISSVSAAIFLRFEGEIIAEARIAFGGVGPTVARLSAAEHALVGGPPTLERFQRAAQIVRETVKPISDVRGAADYRTTLAGNLLVKCFHDLLANAEVAR